MENRFLVEKFLTVSRTEKNLSDRSIKAYRCDLSDFIKYLKKKKISDLSTDDLRGYLSYLESRHLSDTTVKRKLATLKVFYNFLDGEEIGQDNPTKKLQKKYRILKRLPRVLSIYEVQQLLRCSYKKYLEMRNKNDNRIYFALRDVIILEILFSTGIRIDELVKLTIEDLDIRAGTLLITGKGRKERLLFISNHEIKQLLNKYLDLRLAMLPETKALLLNRFHHPLSVHSIGGIFKKCLNTAGIRKHYTPHCLRHTMATMLMENGADVRSVQEILGHSQISTTEIYLSVSSGRRQAVLSKFNQRDQITLSV